MVGFLSRASLADWAWLKWLPHTRPQRSQQSALTLLAWDEEGRHGLARWLLDELTNRRRALEENGPFSMGSSTTLDAAQILLFLDDFRSAYHEPALRMALTEGRRLRVAVVGLAEDQRSIPGACGGVGLRGPGRGPADG